MNWYTLKQFIYCWVASSSRGVRPAFFCLIMFLPTYFGLARYASISDMPPKRRANVEHNLKVLEGYEVIYAQFGSRILNNIDWYVLKSAKSFWACQRSKSILSVHSTSQSRIPVVYKTSSTSSVRLAVIRTEWKEDNRKGRKNRSLLRLKSCFEAAYYLARSLSVWTEKINFYM